MRPSPKPRDGIRSSASAALVDALRLGDARIRGVAAELLTDRIEELAAA